MSMDGENEVGSEGTSSSNQTDVGGVGGSQTSSGTDGKSADRTADPAPKSVAEKISDLAAAKSPGAAAEKIVPNAAYTPNYKFKANQKELEFDDWVKSSIKDPETEKKAREIFEKAHGLDAIKPDRDRLKTEYGQLQETHNNIQNNLALLSHHVQKKDYESFFQALGIPKADIMQYALLQLKLQDATPEQRAAYDSSRQTDMANYQLQQENDRLQATFTQQAVAMRSNELNLSLQKPEVSGVMQAFDARMGRIGAFRDEVINRGKFHAFQGKDITAEQAITEVIGLLGQPQQMPSQGQSSVAEAAVVQSKKPVIPNISGRGSSPVKAKVRTLADLKKLAKAASEDVDVGV